ncbi:hypothetical protein [Actinoplanes sp. NPDC026619]|uniref:hypothetical protein n=1 Tax=Actinoplanes sp. NPDC026619 TaxID=3155798 RepID=UPI0033C03834
MASASWGTGQKVTGERQRSSQEKARTAAVMRSTVEQLRLAATTFEARAAASRNPQTAIRLRVLSVAVSAQADDIQERADRLTHDPAGAPGQVKAGTAAGDDERPLP